jgi:hypothetical protein
LIAETRSFLAFVWRELKFPMRVLLSSTAVWIAWKFWLKSAALIVVPGVKVTSAPTCPARRYVG